MAKSHPKRKRRPRGPAIRTRSTAAAIDPPAPARDLYRRNIALLPSSIDQESRRVQTTISTDTPVRMIDWKNSRYMHEILTAEGCEHGQSVPLLRDHNRFSVDEIVGSAMDMSIESDGQRGSVVGWLQFGRDLDEQAERTWRRVSQGHLRTVSAGYYYRDEDYVDIRPGETAVINNRSYTADRDMPMRVVTRWDLREVSLVVIPADSQAVLRSDTQNVGTQNLTNDDRGPDGDAKPVDQSSNQREEEVKLFLRFLIARGMADSITEVSEATDWARSNLSDQQYAELRIIAREEQIDIPSQRSDDADDDDHATRSASETPSIDPAEAERERQRSIRELAGEDVPAEMVRRACDEGWSMQRASSEFLAAIRSRSNPVPATAPAGHVTGRDQRVTRESLIAGFLLRHGIAPDNPHLQTHGARAMLGREDVNATFLCRGYDGSNNARDIDNGHALSGISFHEMARQCLLLEGRQVPIDQDEMFERAYTTANFSSVFGALINAQILISFMDAPDTTVGWTRRNLNIPDFRENNRIRNTKGGKLAKLAKNGGTAEDINRGEPIIEKYAIERFAGKVTIDEIVMINDSLDVLDETPEDIGMAARAMIPDAVYALLIRNPNMANGTALFHADNSNLNASSALNAAKLEAGRAKMARQTEGGRNIAVRPRYLLVPESLDYTARQLVRSQEVRNGASGDNGTYNPHQNRFEVIAEPRLDDGCFDPITEANVSGSTTSWYLAADRARHTIEVGFRRGTAGVPRIRRKVLDGGQWGLLFDCVLDFGVKALSPLGLQKNNA